MGIRGVRPKSPDERALAQPPGRGAKTDGSGSVAGEIKPTVPTIARPKFLKKRAAAIWNEYAPELVKNGQLTKLRVHQFALYCVLAAEFEESAAKSEKMIASRIVQMNSLAGDFGMNGDPRRGGAPSGHEAPEDPASKYL